MENFSITIYVPLLGSSFDFIIPANMPVKGVQYLILQILHSKFGISEKRNGIMLFDKEDGQVLNRDCSLKQLGIKDGANLVLM